MIGLYWHFVDIIWIFLFPLLYLIDRHLENSHDRYTNTSIASELTSSGIRRC